MYEELTPSSSNHRISRGHENVQFTAEMLRKDLESELRLDNNDIRSYAWYHGRLPRDVAEQLLRNEGDFLIRESVSSTGEHVLTMRWQGSVLHFKINKFVMQQSSVYSKVQFAFERDSFDSIPALIMYHVGNNIPISVASGAVIRHPVNREVPLSYSDVKYASLRRQPQRSSHNSSVSSPFSQHTLHTQPMFRQDLQGITSNPYTVTPATPSMSPGARSDVSDGKQGIVRLTSPQPFPLQLPENGQASINMTRPLSQVDVNVTNHGKPVGRAGSDPSLSPTKKKPPENDSVGPLPSLPSTRGSKTSSVPPKPSRVPSFRRPVIRHDSSKITRGSAQTEQQTFKFGGKELTSKTSGLFDQSRQGSSVSMRTISPQSVTSLLGRAKVRHNSSVELRKSAFNPLDYNSTLLPAQNKPVDGDVMIEIIRNLLGTDTFKLARHMTYIDCEVCKIKELSLEDIFLSKGTQLRIDIMERYQCLSFWVAVCILRGGATKQEKVDILNVFIQIANELVHSLGNVFGFSAIMHGLTCPQLSELNELWTALQHQYTNNAVTMDKKLLPLMRLLDEGKGQINLNSTCIPHLLPILRFLESPLMEIPHTSPSSRVNDKKQFSASEGDILASVASDVNQTSFWWKNLPDDSFDSLMAQLSIAREVLTSLTSFRKNVITKFNDFEKKPRLYEMFTTDFQLRLLWGYKGAESPRKERYEKFDKLITLMAKRVLS